MLFANLRMKRMAQKAQKIASTRMVEEQLNLLKEYQTIHMIELQRICPAEWAKPVEKDKDLKELCDSIRRYGLLEPLVVRRICPDDSSLGGIFTLICGHRRLEALKMLGVDKAPCVICQLKAPAVLPALCSSLFCSKEKDAFVLSDLASVLREERCMTDREIAASLSIDEEKVKNLRKLAKLQEDERKLCLSANVPDYLSVRLAEINEDSARKRWLVEIVHTLRTVFPDERHHFSTNADTVTSRRMIFSDIRPFYNSIEQMAHRMRTAGVSAVTEEKETDEYYELTLRVAKESRVRVMHNSKDLSRGA